MNTTLKILSTRWFPLFPGLLTATFALGACSDDQGTCEGSKCASSSGDGDGNGGEGGKGDGDDSGPDSDDPQGDGDGDDAENGDSSDTGEGGKSSDETTSGDGDGDEEVDETSSSDDECQMGTWDHDEDPETKCHAWTTCEAGDSVTQEGTPSSDRTCDRCEDGTFSTKENAEECAVWSQCPNGVRTPGTWKSDVICEAPIVDLQVGDGFSCVLREDGTVWCWGRNDLGQLGRGDTFGSEVPEPVLVASQRGNEPLHDVVQLSVGKDAACVTRVTEDVWCWGNNSDGQVSLKPQDAGQAIELAQRLEGVEAVEQVQIGARHACAILPLGKVTCWGAALRIFNHPDNEECWGLAGEEKTCDGVTYSFQYARPDDEVARVTYENYSDPALALSGAENLMVGETLTCAALDDGRTTCWRGWYGPSYRFNMEDVSLLTNVTSSSSGPGRSCWLKQNNDVYCARPLNEETPMLVDFREVVLPLGINAVEVEARANGMCVLTDDGTVLCQTADQSGVLPTSAPVALDGLQDIAAIDGGYTHLCALDGEGRVYCDESGQMTEHAF